MSDLWMSPASARLHEGRDMGLALATENVSDGCLIRILSGRSVSHSPRGAQLSGSISWAKGGARIL